MKILYGITKSNFGGAQRYVYELAVEMSREGHDVSVLCGGDGPLVNRLEKENIRVIKIPGFGRDMDLLGDAPRLWSIIKIVHDEKPDVLHINSSKMGGAGIFTGRLLGIKKIIFTSHGWAFNGPRPFWQKWLIRFFAWLTILGAHMTICVSEKSRRDMSSWPFTKNKLVVVHNGIKDFVLPPRVTKDFTVGTIAELHKVKGLDILLRAWDKFSKKSEAKLVIIGEGEERQNLLNLIRELGIEDSVTLKGFVENARAHLSDFDIFVLPSRSEAMPYSLLEAGYARLPVVASSVGGIPEVIDNGMNGTLVSPEDSEALFSSLLLYSENPRMRDRLGATLKETITKDFSFGQMVHATLKVYGL